MTGVRNAGGEPFPREQAGEIAGPAVLVVDDEPAVRLLITEVLADLGYVAIEAVDGPSGLTILQSSTALDLLIVDIGLPGGMDGRDLGSAARAARPGRAILVITRYAEPAARGDELSELQKRMEEMQRQIEHLAKR